MFSTPTGNRNQPFHHNPPTRMELLRRPRYYDTGTVLSTAVRAKDTRNYSGPLRNPILQTSIFQLPLPGCAGIRKLSSLHNPLTVIYFANFEYFCGREPPPSKRG